MQEQRKKHLEALRATLAEVKLGQKADWSQVRSSFYCSIYGLPLEVCITIGMRVVDRYLPTLHIRYPTIPRVELSDYLFKRPLDNADTSRGASLPEARERGIIGEEENSFVTAVATLRMALRSRDASSGKLAAMIEEIVWFRILQRQENVWAADDPAAAAAWRDWFKYK